MKYYGDYLGFRFGEHHSRDLGLYRVSDGDRYNDPSIPAFTDTTAKITGGDGTYYWDSFYTQRTFTINCAFDDLSENQLREIRQIFNGKAEDWLVFDETPYKKYRVKVQSPPQIKYLTFREDFDTNGISQRPRVHKGEITFQFISYYPYGIDNFKTASFARVSSASATTTTAMSGTLIYDLWMRNSTDDAKTKAPAGSTIYIPTEYIPSTNTSVVYYDCIGIRTVDSSNIMYRMGASVDSAVEITKNGSSYSVKFLRSNSAFINALTSAGSIEYKTYYDSWKNVNIDQQTYNKNPHHYYCKNGNLYISNVGWSSSSTYYVPEFSNWQNVDNSYPNASEWYDSVQLLSVNREIDFRHAGVLDNSGADTTGGGYFIYNPGDLETDVKIILDSATAPSNLSVVLKHREQVASSSARTSVNDQIIDQLHFTGLAISSSDDQICIDTAKNLVYGRKYDGTLTGTLYNKYISSGDFFKIPLTQKPDIAKSSRLVDYCDYIWVNIPKFSHGGANVQLDYNYLYY